MEENREFPKKQLLSLQLDLSKFDKASEDEKAQAVVMRESTTFFKDGMRKLRKNPLAMGSLVVLILIVLLIVALIVRYNVAGASSSAPAEHQRRNKAQCQKFYVLHCGISFL